MEIPYKIYLEESEMPKAWYNVRADMKNKPAPLLNPGTGKPMTLEELSGVFCRELAEQELDNTTPFIPIPDEIRNFYKMFRPSPLVRAYCLEKKLGTPDYLLLFTSTVSHKMMLSASKEAKRNNIPIAYVPSSSASALHSVVADCCAAVRGECAFNA